GEDVLEDPEPEWIRDLAGSPGPGALPLEVVGKRGGRTVLGPDHEPVGTVGGELAAGDLPGPGDRLGRARLHAGAEEAADDVSLAIRHVDPQVSRGPPAGDDEVERRLLLAELESLGRGGRGVGDPDLAPGPDGAADAEHGRRQIR